MSNGIDLYIGKGQFLLCVGMHPKDSFDLGTDPAAFALNFSRFTSENKNKQQHPITIYIGDDRLYFTRISLPKQTPDVEKAISLQLDMLSPFGEKCLYASEIQHEKESIKVSLYLANQKIILPVIETIIGLEWHIAGLYPSSQRGRSRENSRKRWGLLSEGLFKKLTIFEDGHVHERIQISGDLEQTVLEKDYKLDFLQNVDNLPPIPSPPSFPLSFNLLPRRYRRVNYTKWILLGLIGVNAIFAIMWVSLNFIQINRQIEQINTQQTELAPKIKAMKTLKRQHSNQVERLQTYESFAKNKNLIEFLATLSQELPSSSYLDQLRLDKKTGAIHIQGYTTNLTDLTTSLQVIGNATLESTRKRKGQTYFQIEVIPE